MHIPTLSNKFDLDTETGETVISVSKTSKSLSIRVSSLEEISCSFTDKTTGLAAMVKNTCQAVKKHKSGSVLSFEIRMEALRQIFERLNASNYHRIMSGVPPFIGIY
jgi:hypothetical protein